MKRSDFDARIGDGIYSKFSKQISNENKRYEDKFAD